MAKEKNRTIENSIFTKKIMKLFEEYGPLIFRNDPGPARIARKNLEKEINAIVDLAERSIVINKQDSFC